MRTVLALAVVVSLGFSACTKRSGLPQNVLRYAIETDPPTLDWSLTNDHVSIEVLYNLQEGLTKQDENLKIIPALAASWDISPDGKLYTFHLRDAKWSDGVPVKAQDFVVGWHRLLEPKRAAEYAYFLFDVENAEAYNSGKIKDPNQVGVKALNDKTLQVRLKHPAAYFLHVPAFCVTAPQRQDVLDAHPTDFIEPNYLRTTGPYRLTEWAHDSRLTLEPNPYYYGGKPSIEKLQFFVVKEDSTALNLYERGELEVALRIPSLDLDRVKKWPDYHSVPILRGYYFGFDVRQKPFDNVLVRKAFAQAIDRRELVSVLKGGQLPATSWIPKGLRGYEPHAGLDFDPVAARANLAKAGYPGGKGFPSITFMYDSLELNKLVAEKLQFAWKQVLGLAQVQLSTQEWKVYLDTLTHSTPAIWRMGWGADYPDPHNFLDLFTSNSGNNNTHWKNAKYDALVLNGAKSMSAEERQQIYHAAQKILVEEDVPMVPLFQNSIEMLVKPYVENFFIDPLENPRVMKARIKREVPTASVSEIKH